MVQKIQNAVFAGWHQCQSCNAKHREFPYAQNKSFNRLISEIIIIITNITITEIALIRIMNKEATKMSFLRQDTERQ